MQTVIRKREGAREAEPRIVFIFISLVRGLFVEMSPAPHKLSVGFATYWANEQTLVSGLQHSNSRPTPGCFYHPCFATRLGGVSVGKETQGWRDSSHTPMVGAGKSGSAKLPMATAMYPGKPSFSQ